MRKLLSLVLVASATILISLTGCNKTGPAGANGKDGTNGVDAIATCKECHNPTVVDKVVTEFALSKHAYGSTATSEAGNTTCGPCHEQEAFKYVCANNISTVFTYDAGTGKWSNPYMTVASSAFGSFSCGTCHSSLHTTYGFSDITPLTNIAPVPMTMWGGAKTINLTQDGSKSNLCVKCHQPRPFTASSNGRLLPYDSIRDFPNLFVYDTTNTAAALLKPGYRTHTHYGTVGAMFAGIGAIEFPGSEPYQNSAHTTVASCQNCHMAPINGAAGGHTFISKGNFNGCNVTGCHGAAPMSANNNSFTSDRAAIKTLLETLAGKLKQHGIEIMNKNADSESNLWYGLTTNNYDGYLNIYDPINNPNGVNYNIGSFKALSTTGFSTDQLNINSTLPRLQLTYGMLGAIINFQICLREYSMGIHNYAYSHALLTNTIAMLP
jgi:hypothetical protein